jgi:hypothetical protein
MTSLPQAAACQTASKTNNKTYEIELHASASPKS